MYACLDEIEADLVHARAGGNIYAYGADEPNNDVYMKIASDLAHPTLYSDTQKRIMENIISIRKQLIESIKLCTIVLLRVEYPTGYARHFPYAPYGKVVYTSQVDESYLKVVQDAYPQLQILSTAPFSHAFERPHTFVARQGIIRLFTVFKDTRNPNLQDIQSRRFQPLAEKDLVVMLLLIDKENFSIIPTEIIVEIIECIIEAGITGVIRNVIRYNKKFIKN